MEGKLTCPHCGKCVGKNVNGGATVQVQAMQPIKVSRKTVAIEHICNKCKNTFYIIGNDDKRTKAELKAKLEDALKLLDN